MVSDIFAVRGAIAPVANTKDAVHEATTRLLDAMLTRNALDTDHIVFALFTVTRDLNAAFPAAAARAVGWDSVPMMCAVEIPVEGALKGCVRALLLCRDTPGRAAGAGAPWPLAEPSAPPAPARSAAPRRRNRRRRRSRGPGASGRRPVHVYLGEAASLRPDLAGP